MTTIKYEIDGKTIDVEVSEEFALTYNKFVDEERRADERHKWKLRKRITSLDQIMDIGGQIEDSKSDFAEDFGEYDDLYKAIGQLLPEQQELIRRIYVNGESQSDIAKDLDVRKQAINNRLLRTLEKLKKFLS